MINTFKYLYPIKRIKICIKIATVKDEEVEENEPLLTNINEVFFYFKVASS